MPSRSADHRDLVAAELLAVARERDAALTLRQVPEDSFEATALRDALAAMTEERDEARAALIKQAAAGKDIGKALLAVTRQRDALAAELYRLASTHEPGRVRRASR